MIVKQTVATENIHFSFKDGYKFGFSTLYVHNPKTADN